MKILVLVYLVLLSFYSFSQKINVSVFYNEKVKSIILSTYIGEYEIYEDTIKVATLSQGKTAMLTAIKDSIELKLLNSNSKKYKSLKIIGISANNVIKYKPVIPSMNQRYYDDDMYITVSDGIINFINHVNIENYVCGVVESESGYQLPKEYYKTQAIISRTFTLENIGKHYLEGFNLCDGVHCQVYKGKNYALSYHSIISEAVNETKDLVIVDTSGNVISAAYHANCGGQTANSEDVWGKALPYLRSVKDSFCQYQRKIDWDKKISVNDFKLFLESINAKSLINFNPNDWQYSSTIRKPYIVVKNDTISFRKIREYFQLRSAYFKIIPEKDSILFVGKGFGHGVGLCQDGAIYMAKNGYNAENIIKYYYKGVSVISYKELPLYKAIFSIQ
jgi:stage II sporulation protein D